MPKVTWLEVAEVEFGPGQPAHLTSTVRRELNAAEDQRLLGRELTLWSMAKYRPRTLSPWAMHPRALRGISQVECRVQHH